MEIKGNNIMFCGSGDKGTGMLASSGVLHRLECIDEYYSVYDVLSYNDVLLASDFEDDFIKFLHSYGIQESVKFFCINCEFVIVCDLRSGDVLSWSSLSDLLWNIRKEYDSFCKA